LECLLDVGERPQCLFQQVADIGPHGAGAAGAVLAEIACPLGHGGDSMDVKQRLRCAHAGQDPVDLVRWCRDALAEIERLEASRFDLFFAAALQGILARSTAGNLMARKSDLVDEARRVAQLCTRDGPGEIR
jgi:hypothetical protein